ncbi:MAG: hypothetical protein NZ740_02005 [Kiritimatiellae bacterium]|nr:hypothetical protein [Kiritimatiellia bacterium]MDW8457864.1 hypothetical protein [Verrucomicrobiota bacterium]
MPWPAQTPLVEWTFNESAGEAIGSSHGALYLQLLNGAGAWRVVMVRLRDRLRHNPIALDFAARLCTVPACPAGGQNRSICH